MNEKNKNGNLVSRFFYFLSKTDTHALQFCTAETRSVQSSIGVIVLITGIMAMISMFFALQSVFFENATTQELFIAGALSFFYAFAIVVFDREVVSVVVAPSTSKATTALGKVWEKIKSKGPYIPRLVFSVIIGIIIAFPLELKVQEDQIKSRISKMSEQENAHKIREIRETEKKLDTKRNNAINLLLIDIEADRKTSKGYQQEYIKECGRGECGPKAIKIELKRIALDEKIEMKVKELEAKKVGIEKSIREEMKTELGRLETLAKEIATNKKSNDLLTQFIALEEIKKEHEEAATFGMFLMLFFIMFEVFPVVTKMFLPYSEYNAYLDARRKLNINKIVGISNKANDIIQKEIEMAEGNNSIEDLERLRIELSRTEITDIFEDILEDSHNKIYEKKA
ncbi:DUF4407 domain-containing protein [Sulfurimonas aquatica]|uniref:DUF4407 domain-containing protein n=1 Tax=Sulfurimonas aquatica TaxID=2672570 RepID=A0A975B0W4_9BACT|nr:DUF4407 domain-containing protein [Sulfurimonas aquatica]QSZ42191.1 DUF4407 domain-containing protein [Sulfurimonas aquatica]